MTERIPRQYRVFLDRLVEAPPELVTKRRPEFSERLLGRTEFAGGQDGQYQLGLRHERAKLKWAFHRHPDDTNTKTFNVDIQEWKRVPLDLAGATTAWNKSGLDGEYLPRLQRFSRQWGYGTDRNDRLLERTLMRDFQDWGLDAMCLAIAVIEHDADLLRAAGV